VVHLVVRLVVLLVGLFGALHDASCFLVSLPSLLSLLSLLFSRFLLNSSTENLAD
jgi:hypothetical protein